MRFRLSLMCVAVSLCAHARGEAVYTTLFSFSGTNGVEPEGQLLQAPDGNLYGTARDTTLERWGNANFGFNGRGTIFRISTNGVFSNLLFFTNAFANAAYPRTGLTLGSDGDFYGTTAGGGLTRQGTVYRTSPNGGLTVLASFNGTNGSFPSYMRGLLNAGNGLFYGTTLEGGFKDPTPALASELGSGGGTVFSITSKGLLRTLVLFDSTNGSHPNDLILGHDGAFYGTTGTGGLAWLQRKGLTNQFCDHGLGTVFRMTANGELSTLVAFNGYNGRHPIAIAEGANGSLFGVTISGGATNTVNRYAEYEWSPFRGEGTIFRLEPNGKLTTLVLFYGANGKTPDFFIAGNDGNFYGTTTGGGTHGQGIIFRLTPNGKFSILYSFIEGSASWISRTTLMQASDGNLYGTTTRKGKNQAGSIFRLTLPR